MLHLKLAEVQAALVNCQRCRLHTGRTNIVFGSGDPNARLVLVGEAPGLNEDLTGVPFVGAAGQLLDKFLARAGLAREKTYIANVIKCRPPGNRDPEDDELAACTPFLVQQLAAIQPAVIVTLGRFSVSFLTKQYGSMKAILSLPQTSLRYGEIPVVPLYHPSYLLRCIGNKPQETKPLFQDTLKRLQYAVSLAN